MIVRFGYKEIFGRHAAWDELCSRLERFNRQTIVNFLFKVGLILHRSDSPESSETQEGLTRVIFGPLAPQVWRRFQVVSAANPGPSTLYDHLQLLALAKVAFLIDTAIGDDRGEDQRLLGEALLLASDAIGEEDARLISLDPRSEGGGETWQLWMLANAASNRGDNMVHALARNYDLYLTDKDHLKSDGAYLSLPHLAAKATGLNVDLLWLALTMIAARWISLTVADIVEGDVTLRPSSYFTAGFDFSPEEIALFLNLVGEQEKNLVVDVREHYRPGGLEPYNPMPWGRWPIVLFENLAIPVSPRLLYEKLMSGLHHYFLNSHALTNPERARFLRFMGTVFEDYVHRLLLRAYGPSRDRYIPGSALRTLTSGKVCDGVVCYADRLVVLEAKAGLYPLGVRAGYDAGAYRRFVQSVLLDAATQVHETIEAIKNGAFESIGLEPDRIKRYYPLVVTLENAPTNVLLHEQLLKTVAARGHLVNSDVARLEVMDVGELEIVEVAISHGDSLLRIVEDKAGAEDGEGQSFTNWWFEHDKQLVRGPHNEYLSAIYKSVGGWAIETLRSRARA